MEDVTDVHFSPLTESQYVRPFRFTYLQDGRRKAWDLLQVHDSVAILIFNITRKKLVFVKQFRPAVYFNSIDPDDRNENKIDPKKYPPALGVTLELCAGIADKNIPKIEIACEEVLEECGYKVQPSDLTKILAYRAGVGVQGAEQVLYYCEVTDNMKIEKGGGIDDEIIEVVEQSIPEVEKWITSPLHEPVPSPPSCLFGIMWFLQHKADNFRKHKHCFVCKICRNTSHLIIAEAIDKDPEKSSFWKHHSRELSEAY